MKRKPDVIADPFGERLSGLKRRRYQILGSVFEFESASTRLLDLVDLAYAGLPKHRLPRAELPRCRIKLVLSCPAPASFAARSRLRAGEPAPLVMHCATGLLSGTADCTSCVLLSPAQRSGLVLVSRAMLRHAYHLRYELIEFAVFTLAARVAGLVPLHAACVGFGGKGALIIGASGAGKSTLVTQCALQGMDFVAEDSVFVQPDSLLATGVGNFVHLRRDALRFIEDRSVAAAIRRAPLIRRRSGVEKFEVNVRGGTYRLARMPLKLCAVVFATPRAAPNSALLSRIPPVRARAALLESQAYAATQPQWRNFRSSVQALPAFELRRAGHPRAAADAIKQLLG